LTFIFVVCDELVVARVVAETRATRPVNRERRVDLITMPPEKLCEGEALV
jgi:hypothetical protein